MPYLLCTSPTLLDQSFPRDSDELRMVAITLGEIQRQIEQNEICLILTDGLAAIVESFEWNDFQNPTIREIYNLLNRWFLQKHEGLFTIDLSFISHSLKHPLPPSCCCEGLVDLWSEEVGKLLTFHDEHHKGNNFIIGIAYERAYVYGNTHSYINPDNYRCFPLVGPGNIHILEDMYDWDVGVDVMRQKITFSDVSKHYKAINARKLERPSTGSHYKLKFKEGRTWPLQANITCIPDCFLNELVPIAGLPLKAIKFALKKGKLPNKILRLPFQC